MRVLITAQAGHGHFAPLIPLAAALRDAGHDVSFGTSERCRDGLAAHGLELEPCGPAWLESDFGHSSEPNNPIADFAKFLDAELIPRLLADLEALVRRRRPDVILSNDFEPVGRVIAERAAIPFVLASSGPRLSRAVRDKRHTYALKTARRLGGLPPGGDLDYSLRWLHLCFAPRDWSFSGSIYDPMREHHESANEHGICPRVADLGPPYCALPPGTPGARPAVLCTFGTVFNKRAELLRTVIAAIARRAARLVVVLGPGADAAALGSLPGCVELHEQAPVSAFLPQVDYVVTHAGAGTLTALQLHGKPSLLLPQGADQPVNAAACLLNGSSVVRFHTLAAITAGVPLPSEPMTEASVAQAFDQLLSDPGYRQRAEQFRASLEALPPLEHAVRLIERLGATRAPVIERA
jgi:UDP:flavonoid glycosyltransferase YjiC (YdhE family)